MEVVEEILKWFFFWIPGEICATAPWKIFAKFVKYSLEGGIIGQVLERCYREILRNPSRNPWRFFEGIYRVCSGRIIKELIDEISGEILEKIHEKIRTRIHGESMVEVALGCLGEIPTSWSPGELLGGRRTFKRIIGKMLTENLAETHFKIQGEISEGSLVNFLWNHWTNSWRNS